MLAQQSLALFLRSPDLFRRHPLRSPRIKEEWNVVTAAFVSDTFYPGMLFVVDVFGVERTVVQQNLQAIGARFFQPAHRP